jgi:hypothetical protein
MRVAHIMALTEISKIVMGKTTNAARIDQGISNTILRLKHTISPLISLDNNSSFV